MVLPFHHLFRPSGTTTVNTEDNIDNEEHKITIGGFVATTIKLLMISIIGPILINSVRGILVDDAGVEADEEEVEQQQQQQQHQQDQEQEQQHDKESETLASNLVPFSSTTGGPPVTSSHKNDNNDKSDTGQRILKFHIMNYKEKYYTKYPKGKCFPTTPIEVDGNKWFLNIHPNGRSSRHSSSFDYSLKLTSNMRHCVKVNQFCMNISSYGDDFFTSYETPQVFEPGKGFGAWTASVLLKAGMESYIAKNDTFTITIVLDGVTEIPNKVWFPPLQQLSRSNFVFTNETACAVIVVQDNDGDDDNFLKEFPVHPYVLQHHAPVLHDIVCNVLQTRLSEGDSPNRCSMDENGGIPVKVSIDMKYVDVNSFETIYEFMYSGDLPQKGTGVLSDVGSIKRLLLAASYLGCIGMKLHAESILVDQFLSLKNAADMAFFAESNTCAFLKESALKLFAKDRAWKKNPKGWRELSESSELMRDLALYQSKFIKETFSGSRMRIESLNPKRIQRMDVNGLRRYIDEKDAIGYQTVERLDGTRDMLIKTLVELCKHEGDESN